MHALDAVSWIAAVPVSVVFAIFINEVALGLVPLKQDFPISDDPATLAILVPAHDEAKGIGQMLSRLGKMLPKGATILVVADNCTDDTATKARACGVDVVERRDAARRGKGFALDFGRTHLSRQPPDCVIILDADCLPDQGTIEILSGAAIVSGRPAQSINLMNAGAHAGPMVEISNFAFMIKNLVRQRGLVRSGGPAMLTGTGMAFPWAVFKGISLASSNIVEDLAITVTLTRDATKPMLVEGARVWSEAATADDTLTQRTRWEHGFISTAAQHAVPALMAGIMNLQLAPSRLGMHLLVPPLAVLFAVGGTVAMMLAVFVGLGSSGIPALILTVEMALSLVLLAIAWRCEGQALLSASAIMRIPLYVLWKIPVYLKLVKGAETEWVRTNRQD